MSATARNEANVNIYLHLSDDEDSNYENCKITFTFWTKHLFFRFLHNEYCSFLNNPITFSPFGFLFQLLNWQMTVTFLFILSSSYDNPLFNEIGHVLMVLLYTYHTFKPCIMLNARWNQTTSCQATSTIGSMEASKCING